MNIKVIIEQTNEMVKDYYYKPGDLKLVDISTTTSEQEYKKISVPIIDASGQIQLVDATTEDIRQTDTFILGGLDFYGPLLKFLPLAYDRISTLCENSAKLRTNKLVLHPFVDKKTRYEDSDKYIADKSYYPKYIKDFVDYAIIPRLLDAHSGTIKLLDTPISFFTYSVGHREMRMIEACMYDIFRNTYRLQDSDIYEIFTCFRGFSIACVPFIDGLDKIPCGFPKVLIFRQDDRGVLVDPELWSQIQRVGLNNKYIDLRELTGRHKHCCEELLFLLKPDEDNLGPLNSAKDITGHGLFTYVRALELFNQSFPDTMEAIISMCHMPLVAYQKINHDDYDTFG